MCEARFRADQHAKCDGKDFDHEDGFHGNGFYTWTEKESIYPKVSQDGSRKSEGT